jgi:hypothetical protein
MDEQDLTGRPMSGRTDYDGKAAYEARTREVDIRRTAIPGRDYDAARYAQHVALAPLHKALRWGPIFAGLATSIVASLLIGSLFLGLGFDRSYGVFGGLTADRAGWGASIATLLAVLIGSLVAGYVSDLRSQAEGVVNGFMVGVMAILTPLVVGVLGGTVAGSAVATNLPATTTASGGAASLGTNLGAAVTPLMEAQVRSALVVAADNAWFVFVVGLLILGVSSLGGYLGAKARERGLEADARRNFERSAVI